MEKHQILIVQNNKESIITSIIQELSHKYDCTIVQDIQNSEDLFKESAEYCAIIAVYSGKETIDVLENCNTLLPSTFRILISETADGSILIDAINRSRVQGFFLPPVDFSELGKTLDRAVIEFEQMKKIQFDSLSDSLTGLYNRRFIDKELHRICKVAQRYEKCFAIIFGDVNKFKRINDNYGHALGDSLLKGIADVLVTTCRGTDLVCRYGGDEFFILIENSTNAQAKLLIKRLNEAMAKLKIDEMPNESFSLSLGEASFPEDGESVQNLLQSADERMYEVKRRTS